MGSDMIPCSLYRITPSVGVSGRPHALPLQMSADIFKNIGILPSNLTGSWTHLHVTFFLLACRHEKYPYLMSFACSLITSPCGISYCQEEMIQLSEVREPHSPGWDSKILCLSQRWRFPRQKDSYKMIFKMFKFIYPITETSFDSFWMQTLFGISMYLKLVMLDFVLHMYVASLDFTKLNMALRPSWLYVNTE